MVAKEIPLAQKAFVHVPLLNKTESCALKNDQNSSMIIIILNMIKMPTELHWLHYYRTFKPVKSYAQQRESRLPLNKTELVQTAPTVRAKLK